MTLLICPTFIPPRSRWQWQSLAITTLFPFQQQEPSHQRPTLDLRLALLHSRCYVCIPILNTGIQRYQGPIENDVT